MKALINPPLTDCELGRLAVDLNSHLLKDDVTHAGTSWVVSIFLNCGKTRHIRFEKNRVEWNDLPDEMSVKIFSFLKSKGILVGEHLPLTSPR